MGAQFIVENNFFGKHAGKILRASDSSEEGTPSFYKIYANGNSPELSASNSEGFTAHKLSEKPWKVPYKYSLKSADEAKQTVVTEAGSGASVLLDGKNL